MTEAEKMAAGDWYTCLDPELGEWRHAARRACHAHSTTAPDVRGLLSSDLAQLFGRADETAIVEAPFHCSYGFNITLGAAVYLNAGCTILDSAPVSLGDRTMCGPGVQIYTADHHRDPETRGRGIERAVPVTIGADVWIGGGAIILPGVTLGAGAIVGAGAVVTRDVAAGARVVGNPARVLPG